MLDFGSTELLQQIQETPQIIFKNIIWGSPENLKIENVGTDVLRFWGNLKLCEKCGIEKESINLLLMVIGAWLRAQGSWLRSQGS